MEGRSMNSQSKNDHSLSEREHDELMETVDEEFEMEIDDQRLAELIEHGDGERPYQPHEPMDRHAYFRELLKLQRELVKLQDWVQHQKLKVVVLFEGRDAAGKGGVIKRVTQRLNPRTCKVVALAAPTERERTIFSVTCSICRRRARSSCSTAAGTTAPASSGSWGSAPRRTARSFSAVSPIS